MFQALGGLLVVIFIMVFAYVAMGVFARISEV